MRRSGLVLLLATLLLLAGSAFADKAASLKFLVVKDYNGKPVRYASVILHPVSGHGKQGNSGFELKTDENGQTSFDGVPYGKIRIQVLMPGYQTFGEDYEINQPEQEFTIRLKRPQKQYSIYDK
jgi:Carboxypeptidase regulatory-like domain